MLTRHGILRERLADTLTDALRASLLRQQGYKVDVVQFVESQHTPRNTMLRATLHRWPGRGRGSAQGVRRAGGVVGDHAQARGAARCVSCLVALLLPLTLVGADDSTVELTFQDPEIIESSGLAVVGDWVVTTNDSGDTGRVFTVDEERRDGRRHRVVGRAARRRGPGAGRRRRGVGRRHRRQQRRPRLDPDQPGPGGPRAPRRRRAVVRARLPRRRARRRDADAGPDHRPALHRDQGDLRRPALRGARGPRPRPAQQAARARRGAADRHRRRVLPRRQAPRRSAATTARSSTASPPSRRSASSTCPTRSRARASRSTADGDLLVSTEGQYTDVLRVPLPAEIRRPGAADRVAVAEPPTSRRGPSPARARTSPRRPRRCAARGRGSSAASSGSASSSC